MDKNAPEPFPEAGEIEEAQKGLKSGEVFEEAREAPIEAGTIFDPEEELKEVLKFKGKGREEKFEEYRKKFAYQKEGLAKMQQAIRNSIFERPDISEEELFMEAGGFAATHGFSVDQIREIAAAVREYTEQHKKIQEVLSGFATEKDGRPTINSNVFFEKAFFEAPLGKVEVFAGPAMIYLRLHDEKDFYQALKIQAYLRGQQDPEPELTGKVGGFTVKLGKANIEKCLLAEIDGLIAIENFPLAVETARQEGGSEEEIRERVKKDTQAIFVHEEQHSVQEIFERPIGAKNANEIIGAETEEGREMMLRRFLRDEREVMDANAKGEMLAYLTGQIDERTGDKILEEGKNSFGRGKFYDYYTGRSGKIKKYLAANIGQKYEKLVDEQIEKILVEEYENIVAKGIDALKDLLAGDYSEASRNRARNLLSTVPLRRWPREVDKFLKH